MTKQQDQVLIDFLAQVQAHEAESDEAYNVGIPALHRLATIAQGDTSQCLCVRRLLLGLYNGHRFPFNLTELRGLDAGLYNDCMDVIRMDARASYQEIHHYLDNGPSLFEDWAASQERNHV